MFSRLSTSISNIGAKTDLFSAESRFLESVAGQTNSIHSSQTFACLDDARRCLYGILDKAFRDLGSLADGPNTSSVTEKVYEYKSLLEKWRLSFEIFCESRKNFLYDVRGQCKNSQFVREIKLIEVHSLFAIVLIVTEPFRDKTLFDEYIDEFSQIVHFCLEVIEEEVPYKLLTRRKKWAKGSAHFFIST